jgi:SAM-dependent methyltransferase
MSVSRFAPGGVLALGLSLAAAAVFAQAQPQTEFKPQVGQQGKDVIWVPTAQALVDKMLNMAKVTTSDYVMDLGSGDGRTVITAAKRGARAIGIEYNPNMVELSKSNAAAAGVGKRAQFMRADLFETDLSQATVITMFLLPDINLKLRPKILGLKPGTRVVSNSFDMGQWQDDETGTIDSTQGCTSYCIAHLWIVPAKAQGTWMLPQGVLTLKQDFQMLSGTLATSERNIAIAYGRLHGDQISFIAGGAEYSARVNGDSMEGTVKANDDTTKFQANRTGN